MSDKIKHECGIAMIRLLKPLDFYIEKYGTPAYALKKMYLLMEKQHNRGQDGAGVVNIKLDTPPGRRFISRYRSVEDKPLADIFNKINKKYRKAKSFGKEHFNNAAWMKENCAFTGELWLGHLRYGTFGKNAVENCHPFLRQNNWRSRTLVCAGNFNMTNVDELFDKLVSLGQHPKGKIDTVTVMEKIGHFLDQENQAIFDKYNSTLHNQEISDKIAEELDVARMLKRAFKDFDGGYAMGGLIGNGSSFVVRDPNGIRPAYFYADDEIVVIASEKPAIKTTFNIEYDQIKEIEPGKGLIIHKNGDIQMEQIVAAGEKLSCSFERIYFSRSSDPDIYRERKKLGELLVPAALKATNFDLKNTVFSYIPNTSETCFLGMMDGVDNYLINKRKDVILYNKPTLESIDEVLTFKPRQEKLVMKDVKMRTFITNDADRDDMVTHVYDTTYEIIQKKKDNVVVIDDSIVRGTTLQKSIITMLDRLMPRKIIIFSSAPQIRYPDCYGIDMSRMGDLIAFRAVVDLIKENGKEHVLDKVYHKCLANEGNNEQENYVKEIYAQFLYEEVSAKITELVKVDHIAAEVEVIFQTIEGLHEACPNHRGDWYFTGDYPTKGGNRVVNKAYINWMEGKLVRAY